MSGGDRIGSFRALDVDDPVAGEMLFGLRKHAVGDRRAVQSGSYEFRLLRAREAFAGYPICGFAKLLLKLCMNAICAWMSFFGQAPNVS
jgi:hypothetical protein